MSDIVFYYEKFSNSTTANKRKLYLNLDYVLAYEEQEKMLLAEKIKISQKANPEDWKAFWLVFCCVIHLENFTIKLFYINIL